MRILVTNDDGINAPGLVVAEGIAREVAGEDGEVWVVAPANEQSGVAHCISYVHPSMIVEVGPRRFSVEGTPADCVLAAIHDVMADAPPDLVLSGVNRGNNAAESVQYSGTVGGAMEAALQGFRGIALSQYYGPKNRELDDPFEAGVRHGGALVRKLMDKAIWDEDRYRLFYNVNFPPFPAEDVRGIQVCSIAWREDWRYAVQPQVSPTGRKYLWITGSPHNIITEPGTDVRANLDGYIAVTPLRADMTAHETLDELRSRLE
ncbi:MAG: 5'/3'-nucleotidase SurE [Pseudomonadota bacterium]